MLIRGAISGTPRTYGNRDTEDARRTEIFRGAWTGCDGLQLPLWEPVEAQFDFCVNPGSSKYRGAVSPSGPDLDTMVVGALDGLTDGRNKERPSKRFLQSGRILRAVRASKRLVDSDEESGVLIQIRLADVQQYLVSGCGFAFDVESGIPQDLREAVKSAAEADNTRRFRGPTHLPLQIRVLWGPHFHGSNVHTGDKLEAEIDGLGASTVTGSGLRFFDPPPRKRFAEYGYHDRKPQRLAGGTPITNTFSEPREPVDIFAMDKRFQAARFRWRDSGPLGPGRFTMWLRADP